MMTRKRRFPTNSLQRLTLYITSERQQLLKWAQEYTQAVSLSAAVFLVLAELKALVRDKRLQALEKAHGIWKDDAMIEQAFIELEQGWRQWRT